MKLPIVFFLLLMSPFLTIGQRSPFNNIKIDSIGENYSFLVSGHFYGGGDNKSGFPANTLLGNIEMINNSNTDFFICLGDLFKDVKNDPAFYEPSLFTQLEIPLFNAVGNHDLTDNIYQEAYGETSFSFKIGNDLHLILDTERDNGDINDDQIILLKEAEELSKKGLLNNLFIYGHRTIWKSNYSELDNLFKDNTQSLIGNNYTSDVLPILKNISKTSKVHFFSGSMGGYAPSSFFYFESDQIKYIVTAIRALKRDAILRVNVENGSVSFETIPLCGQQLKPLEEYNLSFWSENVAVESFNWRLMPLYIKTMFTHYLFWLGVGITLVGMLIGRVIIRKRKKKLKPSN